MEKQSDELKTLRTDVKGKETEVRVHLKCPIRQQIVNNCHATVTLPLKRDVISDPVEISFDDKLLFDIVANERW